MEKEIWGYVLIALILIVGLIVNTVITLKYRESNTDKIIRIIKAIQNSKNQENTKS